MATTKREQIQKRIRELLEYIQTTDEANIPRLKAFTDFATAHDLKCETIRNLYYGAVKQYKLKDVFKIEKCKHFGAVELKGVMQKLVDEINRTQSVRKACYNVSNGDAKLMLRLQNKYRSILKNNPQYLLEMGLKIDKKNINNIQNNRNNKSKINEEKTSQNINNFLKSNNAQFAKYDSITDKKSGYNIENEGECYQNLQLTHINNENVNNNKLINENNKSNIQLINKNLCGNVHDNKTDDAKILRMPKCQPLTDADINNLFMGLVKMVKRNALENAPQMLRNECELANRNLKDAITKLGVSTRKLEIIKCENLELKQKLDESQKMLEVARNEFIELVNKIDKTGHIEELKQFLKTHTLIENAKQMSDK